MPGKCVFNPLWVKEKYYCKWLAATSNRYKAKCAVCCKEIDIANMGESALKKHMKGAKHTALVNAGNDAAVNMTEFLVVTKNEKRKHSEDSVVCKKPCVEHSSASSAQPSQKTSTVPKASASPFTGAHVLEAEILWCLKCVESHYSYKSCNGIGTLFATMFPDSSIARQISGSERKYAYLCHFGIGPHFQNLLYKIIDSVPHITLLFDETLNRTTQLKQMDIHVRYWHLEENCVRSQFLTSAFVGHARAADILVAFYQCLSKVSLKKLIQISMDGPAVNWKFYDLLQSDLQKEYGIECVTIGSCGLHILNNAFRRGAVSTGWDICGILSALYYLFKDSPARREDFISCSELKKLPLKFCNHRWLESAPVCARACEIWDDVIKYIHQVENGKFAKPESKSFITLANAVHDKIMLVKFMCFSSVAEVITPFLEFYQTDEPVLSFFATDMLKLVKHILCLFSVIQSEKVKTIVSVYDLTVFDFTEESSFAAPSKVSLGFNADKVLKEMRSKKQITDKDLLDLRRDCQRFILKMLQCLMEKNPVNYALVRNIIILDPRYMAKGNNKCHEKMRQILSYLVQKGQLSSEECDAILLEHLDFIEAVVNENLSNFKQFEPKREPLDSFFKPFFQNNQFTKLWRVFKMLLILSHGQASVERGFSINKAIEVPNLKEDSYIAQRLVYDRIKLAGGALNIEIDKGLRIAASSARSKYQVYLQEEREKKSNK